MRIDLSKQKAKLVNFTGRSELHGDDRVPAATIRLRVSAPNGLLDKFHPTLRHALFFHDTENPGRDLADVAMESNPDYLPHLRFASLAAPLKWNDSMEGGRLVIHHGVGGRSDIILADIKADKFSITPKAGGTVEIEFSVACKPDEKQAGKLYSMIQTDVEVTIEAPKAIEEAGLPLAGAATEPATVS